MNPQHDDRDRVAHAFAAGAIAALAGAIFAFRTFRTHSQAAAPRDGRDIPEATGRQSAGAPMNEGGASGILVTAPDCQRHGNAEDRWDALLGKMKNPAARLGLAVMTAAVAIVILLVIGTTVPVPWPTARVVVIAVPVIVILAAWGKPLVVAKRVWHLIAIAGLAWIAAIAIWLGFQDVVWPVSLQAQILGAFFSMAGIVTLTGALLLTARALPFAPKWVGGALQSAFIAGAAAAALYVGLTIVAHSFRYEAGKTWLFTILTLGCLALAIRMLPAAWQGIGGFVKGAGITLALLGGAANFWFQSVYLPENTEVGIQYGLSVVSVRTSGSEMLATLGFTMENRSSVTALTLGSMVIVRALTYPRNPRTVSGAAAQRNIENYARELAAPSPAGPPLLNPNIGSSGSVTREILTVLQPMDNNSYLYPDDTFSFDFGVVIPAIQKANIEALEVGIHVVYARSTRLTLGSYYGSTLVSYRSCHHDEQSVWGINQSALVRFTRGAQLFYSHWCADIHNPTVSWAVQATRSPYDTPKVRDEIGADIGVRTSSRNEIFLLPGR